MIRVTLDGKQQAGNWLKLKLQRCPQYKPPLQWTTIYDTLRKVDQDVCIVDRSHLLAFESIRFYELTDSLNH